MTQRQTLPNRRQADVIDFDFDGAAYTATYSTFPNGALAEIFLQSKKLNSDRGIAAKDGAILASIALQFGVPLNVIRHALQRTRGGKAAGALGHALDIIAATI
jgi:hypothetical protein